MSSKYSKSKHINQKSTSEASKYWNLFKNVDILIIYLVIDRNQNGWSLNSISSWFSIDIVTARVITISKLCEYLRTFKYNNLFYLNE